MFSERREANLDPSLSLKIGQMDNTKCTLYKGSNVVFCANLGRQSTKPVLVELNNTSAQAIKDYPTNIYSQQFPPTLRGADKAGSIFAVWGGD